MEFALDNIDFGVQYVVVYLSHSVAPLRSRERAFYAEQLLRFEAEAQRRKALMSPLPEA